MKTTKTLLCTALIGLMTCTICKVSAASSTSLPLKLTAVSGIAYTTGSFNGTQTTTPYVQNTFNLKTVLNLISQIVYQKTGQVVPSNVDLIYDPIAKTTYLTNNLGYYLNLSGIAEFYFEDLATSYQGSFYNGTEKDMVDFGLDVWGTAKDGMYYEIDMYSTSGTLSGTYTGNIAALLTKTSAVKMSISASQGTGYSEYQSSDDGIISDGQMTLSGIGNSPSGAFPFAAWWW